MRTGRLSRISHKISIGAVMSKTSIIGVPMDLAADRRGVDMGPSALRYADLDERLEELGYEIEDLGDMDEAKFFVCVFSAFRKQLSESGGRPQMGNGKQNVVVV